MSAYADNEYLFTSESVTEGHPDKVSDQISGGVLDEIRGRVAEIHALTQFEHELFAAS